MMGCRTAPGLNRPTVAPTSTARLPGCDAFFRGRHRPLPFSRGSSAGCVLIPPPTPRLWRLPRPLRTAAFLFIMIPMFVVMYFVMIRLQMQKAPRNRRPAGRLRQGRRGGDGGRRDRPHLQAGRDLCARRDRRHRRTADPAQRDRPDTFKGTMKQTPVGTRPPAGATDAAPRA